MLDHEYDRQRPSFARLEGADKELVANVRKACEKTDFSLFLATVVKTENGSVDYEDYMGYDICHEPQHRIYNIEKSSFALSHVVEPEDLTFAEDVEADDTYSKDNALPDNVRLVSFAYINI